jgi:hypothetical protein
VTLDAGGSRPDEHEEIVQFGRDRRPRRSRLPTRLILAALLLATVGIVVGRSGTHHATAPPPAPPPVASHVTVTRLGHSLLDITAGWDIFARGPRDLVEIEPALGEITTTTVPELQSTLPDVSFIVGPHQVIVRSPDVVPGYLVQDGTAARMVAGPFTNGGPVVPGPDPDDVWVLAGGIDTPRMDLVSLTGRPAGRDIPLQAGQELAATAVSDGRGYVLLLGSDGNLYDVGPTFSHPIADQIVAIGPTGWLGVSCQARRCHNVVIDPATGASRALAGSPVSEALYSAWPPQGVISPDGATAAVLADTAAPVLRLINLRSGASTTLRVPMANSPANDLMAWSPDSRWLFLAASTGRLVALNVRTGSVQTFGFQLPAITQVAVRPAASG